MQAMNPALFGLQTFVGIALSPSLFGRLAPSYFQLFAGRSTLNAYLPGHPGSPHLRTRYCTAR